MNPNYSLRALALQDLEEIWLYTYEKWGVEQADIYLNLLFARFTWLAENPLIGKTRNDIKSGYYCFPEGMHLVFIPSTKMRSKLLVSHTRTWMSLTIMNDS